MSSRAKPKDLTAYTELTSATQVDPSASLGMTSEMEFAVQAQSHGSTYVASDSQSANTAKIAKKSA